MLMLDAVQQYYLLYAGKTVASFYKVQYEHKNEVWWAVYNYAFVSNFLGYVSVKNWRDNLSYHNYIKMVTFFSRHSVYRPTTT